MVSIVEGFSYVDVHSHSYESGLEGLQSIISQVDIVVVIVSDDYTSSLRTLSIAEKLSGRVIPCVGLHPWSVGETKEPVNEAYRIVKLAAERGVRCLGEVGLDTKFVGETMEKQREVFKVFLEAAKEYRLIMNLHTAGTWQEVYELLIRYDVDYANFHWYTGPLSLLENIEASGYTVSINPAVTIQKKHQAVVANAPDGILLTESDAPYRYKGIEMSPLLVPRVVEAIARIKGYSMEHAKSIIKRNFERFWLPRLG